MENDPVVQLRPNSQTESPASLPKLIEWLTDMMARVRVTNPIARDDPDTAIAALAKRLVVYPPEDVREALELYPTEVDSQWPDEASLIAYLQEIGNKRAPPVMRLTAVMLPDYEIERLVLESRLGQRALDMGLGTKFRGKAFKELGDKRTTEHVRAWLDALGEDCLEQLKKSVDGARCAAAKMEKKDNMTSLDAALARLGKSISLDEQREEHLREKYGLSA